MTDQRRSNRKVQTQRLDDVCLVGGSRLRSNLRVFVIQNVDSIQYSLEKSLQWRLRDPKGFRVIECSFPRPSRFFGRVFFWER
jgi:hypothetical protein